MSRCRSLRTDPAYRGMVRDLLRPGMYRINDRGIAWTEDELEAVVDAYLAHMDWSRGAQAAKDKIEEFRAVPMVVLTQQRALIRLKSVSAAYRRSRIPPHLRKGYPDADWKSTPKAYRRTGQAPGSAGSRRTEALAAAPSAQRALENLLISHNSIGPHVVYSATRQSLQLAHGQNNFIGPAGVWMTLPPGANIGAAVMPLPVAVGGCGVGSSPPYAPAAPLPRSIKAGEIRAWRCWMVETTGTAYRLRSTSMSTAWPFNKPMKMSPEIKPGTAAYVFEYGTYGIHAFKERWRAIEYMRTMIGRRATGAVGEIEIWGEVVEHRIGYRAEYAQIASIEHCTGGEAARAELCAAYGVPFKRRKWWRLRLAYSPAMGPFALMVSVIRGVIEEIFC